MLAGQFIVTGPDLERAEVHVLDLHELGGFRDLEALASKRGWPSTEWLPHVFGKGVTHAFRCSDSMLAFLVSDDGAGLAIPHLESVRAAAACIMLGEPLGGDAQSDEGEGGQGARLQPEPDKRPPGGAAADRVPDALRF